MSNRANRPLTLSLLLTTVILCAMASPLLSTASSPVIDTFTPRMLPLPEGGQLAYYVREGEGPCLLLIPGSWGDYRVFDHLVNHLPATWRIVIIELRGHGQSQPATLECSMEGFARDVLRVSDALGLKKFYAGGHSIGGMIVIEMARQRPSVLKGIIPMEGWTHHEVQREAFGHSPPFPLSPDHEAERLANRARVLDSLSKEEQEVFASVWRQWNGLPILETTTVPVLEIWGDRGRPTPSRALMRIPDRENITIRWIADASHAMLVEKPEIVAEAVTLFIDGLEQRDAH